MGGLDRTSTFRVGISGKEGWPISGGVVIFRSTID